MKHATYSTGENADLTREWVASVYEDGTKIGEPVVAGSAPALIEKLARMGVSDIRSR